MQHQFLALASSAVVPLFLFTPVLHPGCFSAVWIKAPAGAASLFVSPGPRAPGPGCVCYCTYTVLPVQGRQTQKWLPLDCHCDRHCELPLPLFNRLCVGEGEACTALLFVRLFLIRAGSWAEGCSRGAILPPLLPLWSSERPNKVRETRRERSARTSA